MTDEKEERNETVEVFSQAEPFKVFVETSTGIVPADIEVTSGEGYGNIQLVPPTGKKFDTVAPPKADRVRRLGDFIAAAPEPEPETRKGGVDALEP